MISVHSLLMKTIIYYLLLITMYLNTISPLSVVKYSSVSQDLNMSLIVADTFRFRCALLELESAKKLKR